MNKIVSDGLFGLTLSIVAYKIGVWLNQKFKSPILNPLLIAVAIISPILKVCHISYDSYNVGGSIITLFLAPATTVLAYSIYLQLKVLKKYWLPILVGCLTSCIVSIGSTIGLCKLCGLDNTLTNSIITGIFGAVAAPLLAKLLRIKNPVGIGVGLGCSCHAIGTARALELGEIQGAMSSIALGVAGMMTVIISLFL